MNKQQISKELEEKYSTKPVITPMAIAWSIIGLASVIALITIIVAIAGTTINQVSSAVTYIQCCGGNQCTDVVYIQETNTCRPTLCSPFHNCDYQGANKSIDLLS